MQVDSAIQDKYLDPDEKKGKKRNHMGLGFTGTQLKKFSNGQSKLMQYDINIREDEIVQEVEKN